MLLLTLHVGVEEAHVALAAAPEDVALAAELDGGVHGVLDLDHGAGCDVEIRVGGGAVHVALVTEDVGGAPKELDAGLGLLLLEVSDDLLEIGLILLDGGGLVDEVYIVEAIVSDTELLHDLETGVDFLLGLCNGIRSFVPGE